MLDIQVNHNYTIDKSVVSEADNIQLTGITLTPILGKPNKF